MSKQEKSVREPLIHISKRVGLVWWKSWTIRVLAVVCALIFCAIVIAGDIDPASVERIVTLSTCSYDYNDARYVVIGSLNEVAYPDSAS